MLVVTAFLNGDMNGEIFMEQQEGFGVEDSSNVCKLVNSLYGLKQAPRQWHAKLMHLLFEFLDFREIYSLIICMSGFREGSLLLLLRMLMIC
jgi:Reverse transcriptase (RNA-dependent DNA polymerase)